MYDVTKQLILCIALDPGYIWGLFYLCCQIAPLILECYLNGGVVMEIKDIVFPADFLNLTREDTDKIVNEMDLHVDESVDIKVHLYDLKNQLFLDDDIALHVQNKVFAGKTSVKWYTFELEDVEKTNIISKIESESNYYNVVFPINPAKITEPMKYTCIKIGNNTYMMRIMNPSRSRTINVGTEISKVRSVNNITVIINLNNRYIEVRSDSASARKIINNIMTPLIEKEITEVSILEKYDDSLEAFRDSLNNGKFIDVTSKPDLDIMLTKEKNELLVSTLRALDEYFINKDIESLKTELLEVELGTEEIPFTQLFLAGLSQIGMGTRVDIEEDLTDQSLYGILKSYMTNQKGFIKFTMDDGSGIRNSYTIQVGIKTTNSISFRSSATEEAIEYIRNKILGF